MKRRRRFFVVAATAFELVRILKESVHALSVTKVIGTIILKRITQHLEDLIGGEQADFHPKLSCIDDTNNMLIILAHSAKFKLPLEKDSGSVTQELEYST